jgi:hypothetical protein
MTLNACNWSITASQLTTYFTCNVSDVVISAYQSYKATATENTQKKAQHFISIRKSSKHTHRAPVDTQLLHPIAPNQPKILLPTM